jgi:hypothetical protein
LERRRPIPRPVDLHLAADRWAAPGIASTRAASAGRPPTSADALFGRHRALTDRGPAIEPGVRSVNRLSTHFIAYNVARFASVAARFGGFDLDVFIDRPDLSYNWEDLVSHVGTTGDRRIAFPESWPLDVYHCDRKIEQGSIYHTKRPAVKAEILADLERRYRAAEVPA